MTAIAKITVSLVVAAAGTAIMHHHFGLPLFDPWAFAVYYSYAVSGAIVWSAA